MTDDESGTPPALVIRSASSILHCPRCGKGRLFCGVISIVDECDECGLSLRKQEWGDGPAVFGILVVGALVSIVATIVEIKFAPPYWLHAMLWIPCIIAGSLMCLRYGKAALIHMQYRVKPDDFQ